jgi:dTDP-4-amino-4,6-dideoxygalactose transaminase
MFWIKVKNLEERTKLIAYLREQGVTASYHYVPLHSAPAGLKYGRFHGNDIYTTHESERLLRLPMYYGLTENEVVYVAEKVKEFFI